MLLSARSLYIFFFVPLSIASRKELKSTTPKNLFFRAQKWIERKNLSSHESLMLHFTASHSSFNGDVKESDVDIKVLYASTIRGKRSGWELKLWLMIFNQTPFMLEKKSLFILDRYIEDSETDTHRKKMLTIRKGEQRVIKNLFKSSKLR